MIFAVAIDGNTYMLCGIASDCVIDNATEYAAWGNDMGASAYAVLTKDITLASNETKIESSSKVTGTLNGLGYTVYNAGHHYGLFPAGKRSATTAVIKNVNYENYLAKYPLFSDYQEGGTIENVHMSVVWKSTDVQKLFCTQPTAATPNEFSIKNSSFIFTVDEAYVNRTMILYNDYKWDGHGVNMENVSVFTNGTILKKGEEDCGIGVGTQTNLSISDKRDVETVDYMLASNNAVTFEIEGTAKNVWVNGAKVAATQELSQLTVPVKALGTTTILIQSTTGFKMIKTTVADYVITNQATFKTFRQSVTNTYKYAVLANSFTADGTTDLGGAADTQDFAGVLDGLGNTITNGYFAYGWGTWKSRVTGGTIKNITFENMIVGSGEYGIFGDYWEGGTLENVNISAYFAAGKTIGHDWSAFFGAQITANLVMKNCNFIITVPEAFTETQFAFYKNNDGYYSGSLENVNVVTNAQLAGFGEKDYLGKYVDCLNGTEQRISYNNYNVYGRDVLEALNPTNAYAMLSGGKAKATAGMFGAEAMPAAADVLKVYVDGVSVTDYTLETDGITVPTTAGQHTVVIMTKSGSYAALLTAATKEIGSAEALTSLWKTDKSFAGQYIVLTQDITYEAGLAVFDCYGHSDKAGVFDGRGFTVKNFPAKFLTNNDTGFVMKNVTFDNMTNVAVLVYYSKKNTALLNVNIINTTWKPTSHPLVIPGDNTTFYHIVNCNFNLTCAEADKNIAVAAVGEDHYYKVFMNNTTVTYTGTLVSFDDTIATGGADHRFGYSKDGKTRLSCAYNVTLTDKDGTMHWDNNVSTGTVVTA